jgi:hypothetical protein
MVEGASAGMADEVQDRLEVRQQIPRRRGVRHPCPHLQPALGTLTSAVTRDSGASGRSASVRGDASNLVREPDDGGCQTDQPHGPQSALPQEIQYVFHLSSSRQINQFYFICSARACQADQPLESWAGCGWNIVADSGPLSAVVISTEGQRPQWRGLPNASFRVWGPRHAAQRRARPGNLAAKSDTSNSQPDISGSPNASLRVWGPLDYASLRSI